ncbi:transporter substrate-binding domain-containing protein [Neptuniibacter halophilus]|uniref:transporter substrate-binding domain-containing protein n=1 Tax=Neptuniibacter halophilus TaxID=651666 RepID=UPI002572F078|nr:transporter substrate-binding domain-containing protein [Neptuniibacter halophilus]
MIRASTTLITGLLSALTLFSHPVAANKLEAQPAGPTTVVWSRTDFAPFFILEGQYANQGISDQIIRLFSRKISGFNHKPTVMSLKRMLRNAQSANPICHVALLKTPERETFIDYSQPIMQNYGNGIVTTEQGLSKFGLTPDSISQIHLEDYVGRPLTISIHDGRAYEPHINDVISQWKTQPESIFQVKTGLKDHERLVHLLVNGRLDGMIARPEEVEYSKQQFGINAPLFFIPIADTPTLSLGHVGCSKGDWNKPLMAEINRLIAEDPEVRQTINAAYRQWLPEHLRQHYDLIKNLSFSPPDHSR